jgi:nucleotide-binding universal stress UspA family protein
VDAARAQLHAQAESASKEFGIEIHEHAVTGNAFTEIDRLERSLPADILVIGAQGEGFLRHLLLGSTAAALVQHAIRPLLVAKSPEPEPYSNALVGITFSRACRNALEAVAQMAPRANVTALHAVHVPYEGIITLVSVDDPAPEIWRQQTLEAARREVDEFINGARSRRRAAIVTEFGHAAHLLVDRAKLMHADLIAVGKRSSGPVDALFGTVAKRVLERADCDVLVVP